MDIKEIQEILPHRYPFLLVDRLEEFEAGKWGRGYKNVTINEPFFQGHYPGLPIMPGVLIVEAMAQVGALVLMKLPEFKGATPLIAGLEKVKFRRIVQPGDKLVTDVELLWFRNKIGCLRAVATVDDEVVCQAELTFRVARNGERV